MSEHAKDPATLLVQAVGTLPPEDRDAVFAWLLRRDNTRRIGIVGAPSQAAVTRVREAQLGTAGEVVAVPSSAGQSRSGAQQVVPVRFPADQHAQLREWCAEHGFSMATVIRGLVTRFLEMQRSERN